MLSLQNNGADHELSHYNTGATTIRNGVFPPKNYTVDDVHCNRIACLNVQKNTTAEKNKELE